MIHRDTINRPTCNETIRACVFPKRTVDKQAFRTSGNLIHNLWRLYQPSMSRRGTLDLEFAIRQGIMSIKKWQITRALISVCYTTIHPIQRQCYVQQVSHQHTPVLVQHTFHTAPYLHTYDAVPRHLPVQITLFFVMCYFVPRLFGMYRVGVPVFAMHVIPPRSM